MKNSRGFTLIEVLIATAIMVVVMGGVVYGLSQCSNLTETVRNQDIALNAAQEKLEEIANSDLRKIMKYNSTGFAVDWLEAIPGAGNKAGIVQVTEVTKDQLYDVTVTVTWQQRGGRQLSRSLTTSFIRKIGE